MGAAGWAPISKGVGVDVKGVEIGMTFSRFGAALYDRVSVSLDQWVVLTGAAVVKVVDLPQAALVHAISECEYALEFKGQQCAVRVVVVCAF